MVTTQAMKLDRIRVGTSGWNYWHWVRIFYPEGLARAEWLDYYMQQFSSLELNSSFYRMHTPATYARWRNHSPRGFLWSLKASREITHLKRLRDVAAPLARFFKSADALSDHLGAILFQLPPSLQFDSIVALAFFKQLPSGYHCALEPRHASWLEKAALHLLARHRVALCIADSGGHYPMGEDLTSDFVYLRLHGPQEMYASEYRPEQIVRWSKKLKQWRLPGFVYFDNDFHGYAVKNAIELEQALTSERARARATA